MAPFASKAAQKLWKRQWASPFAHALHRCHLYSDEDLKKHEDATKTAKDDLDKADKGRREYVKKTKKVVKERDDVPVPVGDRCFVTFRYAADANAALQAFAPPLCGSPCFGSDDDDARHLRVTRAPEVDDVRWANLTHQLRSNKTRIAQWH